MSQSGKSLENWCPRDTWRDQFNFGDRSLRFSLNNVCQMDIASNLPQEICAQSTVKHGVVDFIQTTHILTINFSIPTPSHKFTSSMFIRNKLDIIS